MLTNLASMLFGFALFASLIGTASYVEAPAATGYGFGSSIVVGGLCLLPSGLLMLLLSPVAARLIDVVGSAPHADLGGGDRSRSAGCSASSLTGIALGDRGGQHDRRRRHRHRLRGDAGADQPQHPADRDLAAANGLNSLARTLGSSLASAIGGSLLTVSTVVVAGVVLPSLGAYRSLFAACAVARRTRCRRGAVHPAPADAHA